MQLDEYEQIWRTKEGSGRLIFLRNLPVRLIYNPIYFFSGFVAKMRETSLFQNDQRGKYHFDILKPLPRRRHKNHDNDKIYTT